MNVEVSNKESRQKKMDRDKKLRGRKDKYTLGDKLDRKIRRVTGGKQWKNFNFPEFDE